MSEDDRPDHEEAFAYEEADEAPEHVIEEDEDSSSSPLDLASEDEPLAAEPAMSATPAMAPRRSRHSDDDDAGDFTRSLVRDAATAQATDWVNETSASRIGAELRHIEQEIRTLLEGRDPKRKRKFAGTRRWFELEEDLLELKFTGRLDEELLTRIQLLVARRHHLFRRLRFLAGTRPGWNS